MKNWGMVLAGLGLGVAFIALLFLPSTVSTEQMTTLPYTGSVIGSGRFTDTYNLPRAQFREMVFQGGCVLFLSGILMWVGGVLEGRLARTMAKSSDNAAKPSLPEEQANQSAANGPDVSHRAQPVDRQLHDEAALAAEAARNKEIMAVGVGAICFVVGLIALIVTTRP